MVAVDEKTCVEKHRSIWKVIIAWTAIGTATFGAMFGLLRTTAGEAAIAAARANTIEVRQDERDKAIQQQLADIKLELRRISERLDKQ